MKFAIGPKQIGSDGTGQLTATPPTGRVWSVTQISVQCDGAKNSQASVFVDSHLVCASQSGNQDTAAGAPFVIMRDAETLIIQWANASPGANIQAWVSYDDATQVR
jgi:purine nucleoside permease